MTRTDPPQRLHQLTPIHAWLLGHIDTPELRDHLADSAELSAMYGRVIADPLYATTLTEEAQRALEDSVGRVESGAEQAYAMYEAATDTADEARLLAQETLGQPVGDELRERARDFRDACRSLGLPPSADQVSEPEAEAER